MINTFIKPRHHVDGGVQLTGKLNSCPYQKEL